MSGEVVGESGQVFKVNARLKFTVTVADGVGEGDLQFVDLDVRESRK